MQCGGVLSLCLRDCWNVYIFSLNNYHKSWNVLWSSEPSPLGWRTKLQTCTTNITGIEKIGNTVQCTLLWSELDPHLETYRVCSLANRILEVKRERVMKKSPELCPLTLKFHHLHNIYVETGFLPRAIGGIWHIESLF